VTFFVRIKVPLTDVCQAWNGARGFYPDMTVGAEAREKRRTAKKKFRAKLKRSPPGSGGSATV
jgi:hypothetical protein